MGEVCKYDMEKSSNTRVAREETTDEATDVSSEHWGRGAELNGDQVAGLEAKSSREKVPGAGTTDEAPDDEHRGLVVAAPHPREAPDEEHWG